jgi:hypothetical protein
MTTTFQTAASELYNAIETCTRDDGTKYLALKEDVKALDDWRSDAVYAAHEDGQRSPNDHTWEIISEAAEGCADCEDEDSARERLDEIEADPYTSDLTTWLASHAGNHAYLDEYVQDLGGTENLLSGAQWLWKQEIAGVILQAVQERTDELESNLEEA